MKLLQNVDKTVFGVAVTIYLIIFAFIFIFPETASVVINNVLNFTLDTTGWIFILIYIFGIIMLFFFGFTKYGKLRLGADYSKPKYSFYSWMAMLFCTGLGVGIVFFGVNEPMTHFMQSPYVESGTIEAAQEAMRITFFHWGIFAWAIYAIIGLCMAWFQFRKGLPGLISSSFAPMLGYGNTQGKIGRFVDTFSLIATICGASMSLGFAALQFSAGLRTEFGLNDSFLIVCLVTILIGGLAMTSSLKGIDKGIKFFSDTNMYLVIFFLIFGFVFGAPILYIIEIFIQGFGSTLYTLPDLAIFMDAYGTVESKMGYDWINGWTLMYWAWWAAFGPFVGGFLADISEGRTVREFVFACTFVPATVCCLWFAVYGGGAIYMELFEGADIGAAIVADSNSSLFIFLEQLPLPKVFIPLSMVLILLLIVTSVDSATYVAASFCQKGNLEPSGGMRAFWGAFVIINTIAFLLVGGIAVLKSTAIVLAFPFIIIVAFMIINLYKDMKATMDEIEGEKE